MRCSVYGCSKNNQCKDFQNHPVSFFSFPSDKRVASIWKNLCCRKDKFNIKYARICSNHFQKQDYVRNLRHELLNYEPLHGKKLKPDAVPSLNLPNSNSSATDNVNTVSERNLRKLKKDRTEEVQNILSEHLIDEIPEHGVNSGCITNVDSPNVNTNTVDACVSTDLNMVDIKEKDQHILKLEQQVASLQEESNLLKSLFSSRQIKKLSKKKVNWTLEDISKSIVLYSAGPRAYRMLLKKGYPFPAVSTLRSWLKNINLSPGILKPVLNIVKRIEMPAVERISVISFDEVKVRQVYEYDKASDSTMKASRYAQVIMLRGLVGNWKQPIFYDFDCNMTKDILMDVIQFVETSGFNVVAVVSDLGGSNRGLFQQLNVDFKKSWFINPANTEKIFVFADVPHLIKLLRNHFIDDGFTVNDKKIDKSIIEKLLELTDVSDLKITNKISRENIDVKGPGRQKVKLATKLFSHTISCAISRCGTLGKMNNSEWSECSNFFKQVNDWFDVFNSKVPKIDSRTRMQAFGLAISQQEEIIDSFSSTISKMKVGNKSMLPFQKGILMSNNSLKMLFHDLKRRFDLKYILTYRLNQDVLETFFGAIRAKGGLFDHPSPLEFKYRLRSYILGRNDHSLTSFANVEEDGTPNLAVSEEDLSKKLFSKLTADVLSSQPNQQQLKELNEVILEENELEELASDGLEHLAGFIGFKLQKPACFTTEVNYFSWTDHLSEGGFKKLSPKFMSEIEELENIFKSVNGDSILISSNYLKNLVDLSSSVNCSKSCKTLFFRSRMFFRMRQLNKDLTEKLQSRKRKYNKILN